MKRLYKNSFDVIVAAAKDGCIGVNGKLPWKIPEDTKYFAKLTTNIVNPKKQNAVVMGRKTWDSIPRKFRPLKDRKNIVISRSLTKACFAGISSPCEAWAKDGAYIYNNFDTAINGCCWDEDIETTFVIGGGEIYKQALQDPRLENVYLTEVDTIIADGDAFFPKLPADDFRLVERSENKFTKGGYFTYNFSQYRKRNKDEERYQNLLQKVIDTGIPRKDRTGVGAISTFGERLEFDLRHSFPLLTTKKVFWKGIVEELLWFIRGSTDAKELQDKGIHIWDGNSSREFLDQRGLTHYREGDCGPIYGFNWRHFGADYKGCDVDYTGQGVDQLQNIIDEIKKNPTSRRLYMSAWNPKDESKISLPPCHLAAQFYVDNSGGLSCQMYMRSNDLFLGNPFNIASYALLTKMVAQVTDLKANRLIMCLGDTHVYQNHIKPCQKQISRVPRRFPRVELNPKIKNIDEFTFEDILLEDYYSYPAIKAKMAV